MDDSEATSEADEWQEQEESKDRQTAEPCIHQKAAGTSAQMQKVDSPACARETNALQLMLKEREKEFMQRALEAARKEWEEEKACLMRQVQAEANFKEQQVPVTHHGPPILHAGSVIGKNHPQVSRYQKIAGCADMSGQKYEFKMASLLLLRGINHTDEFYLGTNVACAGAFDDILFKYKPRSEQEYRTCLIQCKHKRNCNPPILLKDLVDVKGKFSIYKYYKSSCEVESNVKDPEYQGKVLFDVSFEKCDFVIYTNALIDSDLVDDRSLTNPSVLRRAKIFATGKNTDTQPGFLTEIAFTEMKDEVKKLMTKKKIKNDKELQLFHDAIESDQHLLSLKDFFVRLQWFTEQAKESELDALIQDEIKMALETNEEDTVKMAKMFVEKMQGWWEEEGESEVLTETAQLWSDVIVSRLDLMNEAKRNEEEALNINFTDQEIDSFNQSLSSNVVNVTSPHVKLTSVKISQMLEKNHINRYIFIDSLSRKSEFLCLWQSVWCDVLVVECSTVTQSLVDEMKTLADDLNKTSPGKKLIFLSQSALPGYEQHPDIFNWNQLEATSQKMILEKKVDFQGCDVSLGSVVGKHCTHALTGEAITQLISPGAKLTIGKKIPDNISYYIPRTLARSDYIIKQTFSKKHQEDYFVISNVKEQDVTSFEDSHDIKLKKLDENQDNVSHHFYWTDNTFKADTFTRFCQKIPDKNVHWLSVQNNRVYWKQSFNNMGVIKNNIDKIEKRPITAEDLNERVVLVAAEPGMGKTTYLNKVAQSAKSQDNSLWVIRINLNDITKQLKEHPEPYFKTHINVRNFLINNAKNCVLDEAILRTRLQQAGNVTIYLDGFDEISPYYNGKVTNMIKSMMKLKVGQIWLTSRNVMRQHLETELGSICYSMKPFTNRYQFSFLLKLWNVNHSIQIDDKSREFARNLLQKASESFSDKDREFTGIPLQCMMLGEVFAEDVKRGDLNLPQRLDLLQLFETFISTKLNILNEDKDKKDSSNAREIAESKRKRKILMENHSQAAILLLLPDEEIELLKVNDKCKLSSNMADFKEGEEWTGLVDGMTDGKPSFIHRSFAEFFLAWWLSENILSSSDFIAQNLFEPRFVIVLQFFDRLLTRDCPLHNAVLSADREQVEALLTSGSDVNQIDKGGRSALHLAASLRDNVPKDASDIDNDIDIGFNLDTAEASTMQLLLTYKADVNVTDRILQETPLRYADKTKLWGKVEHLLKNKANTDGLIELRNLINTAKEGYLEAHKICYSIVRQGCFHILKFVLNECKLKVSTILILTDDTSTLLHASVESGREDSVKFLLDAGADIMLRDEHKRLPIHVAAKADRHSIIPLLIEAGSDINAKGGEDHFTPLHFAAAQGFMNTVTRLVGAGAELEAKTCNMETSLHLAVKNKHLQVAKYVFEAGADVNAEAGGFAKWTPLHYAAESGQVDIALWLVDAGAELDTKNWADETPLHLALKIKQAEVAVRLIEAGADQHCADSEGNTPAMLAEDLGPVFIEWVSFTNTMQKNGVSFD